MKPVFYRPNTRPILCLMVLALLMVCVFTGCKPSEDTEEKGLSDVQCENLYTLGKVWGVVKYYHPAFTTGAKDWDEDFLTLLPQVMAAKDAAEAEALLVQWLQALDKVTPNEVSEPYNDGYTGTRHTKLERTTDWLHDGSISPDLSKALVSLMDKPVTMGANGPMTFNEFGASTFENEKIYKEMNYDDDALRLLALFRYWNVIEFYYPYKDILDDDWNAVLVEFIPRILEGDELAYKLTLAELTTRLHDSHTGISDYGGVLDSKWGNKFAPLRFAFVEDKIVVTELSSKYADTNTLQVGDMLLKRDGTNMEDVIQESLKYCAISREDALSYNSISRYLFATTQDSMKLTVSRNGQTLELDVPCYEDGRLKPTPMAPCELLEDNIGLINPNQLKEEELPGIMETFKNTKGLIIDLRQYPDNINLNETLPEYIMPHPAAYANLSHPDPQAPGRFYVVEPSPYVCGKENPDYYKGKIVILIHSSSMSQQEFATMALRQAPNATVIGSASMGTNGNIRSITLPGNVLTTFSSKGVYTPEGEQTQRIGLQPDIVCKPTIDGITQGHDELLEKAIQFISSEASK